MRRDVVAIHHLLSDQTFLERKNTLAKTDFAFSVSLCLCLTLSLTVCAFLSLFLCISPSLLPSSINVSFSVVFFSLYLSNLSLCLSLRVSDFSFRLCI